MTVDGSEVPADPFANAERADDGQLIAVEIGPELKFTYTYDEGRVSVGQFRRTVVHYVWEDGRLVAESADERRREHLYDEKGRRVGLRDRGAGAEMLDVLTIGYDSADRIVSANSKRRGGCATSHRYEYEAGRLARVRSESLDCRNDFASPAVVHYSYEGENVVLADSDETADGVIDSRRRTEYCD